VLPNSVALRYDEESIDSIFDALNRCQRPGVAVGIGVNGRPVYRKGFGLANLESPAILTPATRMRLQSTTKHFTCLAYMLLCEKGMADLDYPVRKYLPELHPITHPITMRQLMGHVSGIRDSHDIRYQFSGTGQEVATDGLVSLYQTLDDVNFAPGTGWCYCNGGYGILSVVIERIMNAPLEEVLQRQIFDPVGMYDTVLRRYDSDFLEGAATNHMQVADGSYRRPPAVGALAGNGGLVSTVNDMLRWLAHMDAPVVGSPATWELMKRSQVLANGTSTGYGLGLIIGRYRGVLTLSHPGGTLGGNSQMLKVPEAGLDVLIMSNRDDLSCEALACRVLDACLTELEPVKGRYKGPGITGVFRSSKSARVVELFPSNGLQFATLDGSQITLEQGQGGELQVSSSSGLIKQSLQLIGQIAGPDRVLLNDFGNIEDFDRVPRPGGDESGEITGTYVSDSSQTQALIRTSKSGVQLTTTGAFGSAEYRLECIGHHTWRARADSGPFGGILSFSTDRSGFLFSSRGTRGLPFKRRQ